MEEEKATDANTPLVELMELTGAQGQHPATRYELADAIDACFDVLLDGLNSYSALLSGRQRRLRSLLQPRACRLTVSISYFLTGLL
jgi:hypothetical protein